MKRKICVLTSSRADYNHLYILMNKLREAKDIDFKLIITGMHTLKKFGFTYKEIINDGFKPNFIIKTNQKDLNEKGMIETMSIQLEKAYSAIKKIDPDIFIVLGDRYDMYPFALACHIIGTPIAHFHGGEVTTGAIDDALRHSVSKLADIHFVANKEFEKRLIQMGERKKFIYNVGSLGIDAIKKIKFNERDYLSKINKKLKECKYFLISLHPETIDGNNQRLVKNVLTSLKKYKKYTQVFSYPNSDTGSNIILKEIKNYINSNKNSVLMPSYGREEYLHLLKYSEFLIGNSSSGFVEAPYLNTPTVNVGTRQKGRPVTKSIFNASYACSSILKSIKNSLNYKKSDNTINYKGKNTINAVLRILKTVKLDGIKNKSFIDIR